MQTLLVEDDALLARGLSKALSNAGFQVSWAANAAAAKASFEQESIAIVVLDLGLPDLDGVSLLEWFKSTRKDFSAIILTARDSLEDKVKGLELGADDYLTKPFAIQELIARLNVIKRRIDATKPSKIIFGSVEIDITEHSVCYENQRIDVSASEFIILQTLMEQPNRIHTRSSLEQKLYSDIEHPSSNSLEVHIHNLRKKISKEFIKTIRGVGYKVNN